MNSLLRPMTFWALTLLAFGSTNGCQGHPTAMEAQPQAISGSPSEGAAPRDLQVSQSWSGDFPVAELKRLPEGQRESPVGYLGDAAALEAIWKVFRPEENPPDVDFEINIVVFTRNVQFYNRTNIFKVELKEGVAEVLAMETMSAMPIEDRVAMALAVIPRAGVKSLRAGDELIPVR